MALKRVIAHFMHEDEQAAAVQALNVIQNTESYVLGEIDEADIPALEAKGLIVQEVPQAPQLQPTETPKGTPGVLGIPGGAAEERAPSPPPTKPDYYLIGLKTPLVEAYRKEFDDLKVRLLEYVPTNYYTARLTPAQRRAVKKFDFVSSVLLYTDQVQEPVQNPRRRGPGTLGGGGSGSGRAAYLDIRRLAA